MFLRKVAPVIAVGALVVILAGCGGSGSGSGSDKSGPTGDAVKGKEVFDGTCISCHGADAKGMPNLGKNLVVKSDWMKKQDNAALVAFVKNGRTAADPENTTQVDMPPKGGNPSLTDDDIVNVIAYMRSLQAASK